MKRSKALADAKGIRPSDFTDKQIMKWLLDLDGQLMLDYVAQYATKEQLDESYGGDGVEDGITIADTINETKLITSQEWLAMAAEDLQAVPPPYDGLYVDYLVMQIDLHNADYERYNNDAILYAEQLRTWRDRLSRINLHYLSREDPDTGRHPTALSF